MIHFKSILFLIAIACTFPSDSSAQHDSTYYTSYAKLLTGRFYLSQKFTSLKFQNTQSHYTLNYQPNTNLTMGVGATYKWATLNLAYGFAFLNPDDEKGKTHYLDLQFHGYNEKFTLDVLGQFYKGFYLSPKGTAAPPNHYYVRPDMRVNIMGGSFQHILNYKRYSLRASFQQTEWQKKSAGSLLVGLEAYTGRVRADSTLTPASIDEQAASLNETKAIFFVLGPNLGYAYTLVVQKNFFLTGSASVSVDYGVNTLTNTEGKTSAGGISSNVFSRLIAGYNSARWALSVIYINNGVHMAGANSNRELILNSGNVRVSFVHRFVPGRKEKELLQIIK